MCGILGQFGDRIDGKLLAKMVATQRHRGPDAEGVWVDQQGGAGLGHNRLAILDLSAAGEQPMINADGSVYLVFNGEIYNYLELRAELAGYPFRTRTDTEVLLAAYERWGEACLDRLVGMFVFLLWDRRKRRLFAARDRFGVKPLYYADGPDGTLLVASEIKSLHAAGVDPEPDAVAWATYLSSGLHEYSERTFWRGVSALPPGHSLIWQGGRSTIRRWYDLAERVGSEADTRPEDVVRQEYRALLEESVRLRFRSDVPVGINLSGGLDSSTLLGLVHAVQGPDSNVRAFTFVTGDPNYDELPWVRQMLERTAHPLEECLLRAEDVPAMALSVARSEDEPFGGIPTLAYARVFERARATGTIVLLDGQGMDEQWAGYDYYVAAAEGKKAGIVQGSVDRPVRPECLTPDFRALAEPFEPPKPFGDPLRDTQYRDAFHTKIPRALRFNDRVSMRSSTELREPFLDHRLFELAMRQPAERKIAGPVRKRMLRDIAGELLPSGVVQAPKRPLQTPQREWLRGPLSEWARDWVDQALAGPGGAWLQPGAVNDSYRAFMNGQGDNSFYIWQWVGLGLALESTGVRAGVHV